MEIRTNLTEKEAITNMIELALFLEKNGGTDVSVEVEGMYMRFEAYMEVEEGD